MQVDIWSDVVCPWCYLGKRRFEIALAQFPHHDEVEVTYHSFELDPAAPATREGAYAEPLVRTFGAPLPDVHARLAEMASLAAQDGLDYRFDIAQHANTFDAHRLLHLARERGVQHEVNEALFRTAFTEGGALSDHPTLQAIGVAAGLPADEVAELLVGERYADAVRADEQEAAEYSIGGVPFFVIDGRYGVSGAQSVAFLRGALEQAWETEHTAH